MLTDRIGTFVVTGDSFSEGLEDDLGPGGRHQGWADRVGAGLAQLNDGVRYANLAVRGKVLGQVVDEQVPAALALAPDLISFHAGPNDLLRPRVDRQTVFAQYDETVARLRAAGAEVLLFTAIGRTGGTGRTADALASRFAAFSEHVHRVGEREGCLVVDIGARRALQDRRIWHEDRLHLNPEGHRRVAAAVLEALGVTDETVLGGAAGWWEVALPAAAPPGRITALSADVRWARRHLAPWVGRRLRGVSSGDGLMAKYPELVEIRPVP